MTETGEVAASASVAFEAEIARSAARPTRAAAPGMVAGRLPGDDGRDRRAFEEHARVSSSGSTAVAVDGTSGTLVAVNGAGEPLRPGADVQRPPRRPTKPTR